MHRHGFNVRSVAPVQLADNHLQAFDVSSVHADLCLWFRKWLEMIIDMKTDIVTLCNSAVGEPDGRLHILGAFERIAAASMPHKFPPFCAAVRASFDESETGNHKLTVRVLDIDGRVLGEALVEFQLPKESFQPTSTLCIAFPISGMELRSYGEHAIDLILDGISTLRTPFYVVRQKK
jgi:hypothetical protein